MEVRTDKPPTAWTPRGRALRLPCSPRPFALLALGATLLLLGCGSSQEPEPRSSSLVAGERAAPTPPAQLASAATVARRFASAYAGSIYRRRLPRLADATAAVRAQLEAAALRVPPQRRGRRAVVDSLGFDIAERGQLRVNLGIADGISPPFSIGFTVALRAGRWRVVSVSTPE
ncbi:MAG: hypothetical protein R2725_07230 [Solirubrobacterales bacterium]